MIRLKTLLKIIAYFELPGTIFSGVVLVVGVLSQNIDTTWGILLAGGLLALNVWLINS